MPITWKNVSGPASGAGIARLMEGGIRNITGGLSAIGDAIDQRNTRAVDRNTNEFFDALEQYQTVDELEAARETGDLTRLRQSIGPVDASRIRGAVDNRLTSLRENYNTERNFDDQRLSDKLRPAETEFNAAIARREFDIARAILDANQEDFAAVGQSDEAEAVLVNAIRSEENRSYTHKIRDEDRAAILEDRAEKKRRLNLQQAQEKSANLLSEAVDAQAYDSGAARQEYLNRVKLHNEANPNNKIDAGIAQIQLKNLDDVWKDRWDITDAQQQEYEEFSALIDAQAQTALSYEHSKLTDLTEQNAQFLNYAWNDPKRTSIGDVDNILRNGSENLNMDIVTTDEGEIEYLKKQIDKNIEKYWAPAESNSERAWGVKAKHFKGDIYLEVAKRLSGDIGWITNMDGVDLRQGNDVIQQTIQEVLNEFQESQIRSDVIKQAQNESKLRMATMGASLTKVKKQELDSYKNLNRAFRSGIEN